VDPDKGNKDKKEGGDFKLRIGANETSSIVNRHLNTESAN